MKVTLKTKNPIDVRIVTVFLYAVGFFQLIISALLITGIARLGGKTHYLFFGIFSSSSELFIAIFLFCLGFMHLLCAWGLIRGCKFSWWLLLINEMYYLIVNIFLFRIHRLNALIGLGIIVVIITWLFFQRSLYKVGLK